MIKILSTVAFAAFALTSNVHAMSHGGAAPMAKASEAKAAAKADVKAAAKPASAAAKKEEAKK